MSATCSGRYDMMLQNHPINWVVPWLFPAALYVATRPSVGLSKIPCTGTWPWNIFHLHQVISHQKWTRVTQSCWPPPKSWPASVWIPSYPIWRRPSLQWPRSGASRHLAAAWVPSPAREARHQKSPVGLVGINNGKSPFIFFWVDVPIKSLHG